MLDGRYPSEEFAELRPRIVWDRVAGHDPRARRGARQLAVTNAGTIPDRGLYGVHLPDGRRVGELDEEMVYEARAGPDLPARRHHLADRGDHPRPRDRHPGAGRARRGAVLARRRRRPPGRARPGDRRVRARGGAAATEQTLAGEYDLDERAARNLVAYLREQQAATRVVPSDRTIVVERFRDEIGDWRLCVLSPFGGRVHAAWGLALSARIRDELDLEADAIWSDDGIIVHLPDADEPPAADLVLIEPDEIEDLVVARARRSRPVRRALPRERRALAADPARLSRASARRSGSSASSRSPCSRSRGDFPHFPIILETYRECLRDVLDLPGAAGAAARAAHARDLAGRGRDADRLAVRLVAAVRLRRHLHVRGRHADRRAPRGGARRSTATCCASCSARRSCAS